MEWKKYNSRDEEIRAELLLEKVIKIIKTKYAFTEYDPSNPNFDAWNQLLACEALAESSPVKEYNEKGENENVSVNGMISGIRKPNVNFELTESKEKIITELKKCDYRTAPTKLASLLNDFFKEWKSKPTHWLYVAQNYPPRRINYTIDYLVKRHSSGQITFQNPAAYFTKLIKFRKKRKNL